MTSSFNLGLVGGAIHGCEVFGSGQGNLSHAMAEQGRQGQADLVDDQGIYPGFVGGTGNQQVEMVPDDEDTIPFTETGGPMSSLDYVVQNLQCRLGNPRNRCYAKFSLQIMGLGRQLHGRAKTLAADRHRGLGTG